MTYKAVGTAVVWKKDLDIAPPYVRSPSKKFGLS